MGERLQRSEGPIVEIPLEEQKQGVWGIVDRVAQGDGLRRRDIIEGSHRFEPAFVATELVRRERAGYLVGDVRDIRTGHHVPWIGVEGYSAGMSPEDIVSNAVAYGVALHNATVGKAKDYQQRRLLLQTAQGVSYDMPSYLLLNAALGATLGRMRAQRSQTLDVYDRFRTDTYRDVEWRLSPALGPNHTIFDVELPEAVSMEQKSLLPITQVELNPHEREGLQFLFHSIRAIGNPLVRSAMHIRAQDNPFAGPYNPNYLY